MSAVPTELVPLSEPTLVEASAGTGKTQAITTYFVRAILEHGLTPGQILVVTYTKAATAELRMRARQRILDAIALLLDARGDDTLGDVVTRAVESLGRVSVEERLRSALTHMDQAPILTIHGFCQRLLQDHPLLFGIDFDFEITEDASSVCSDVALDFWATELYASPEWLLHALKDNHITPEHLAKLGSVAMMPGIDILGPESEETYPKAAERWSHCRRDAAEIWERDRAEISGILFDDPALDRRTYHRDRVETIWLPALDELFMGETSALPHWFSKLAQGQIKTKKNCDPPQHPFFAACARLAQRQAALDAAIDRAVFELQARFIEEARKHARQRRRERALLTYDDLLLSIFEPLNPQIAKTIQADYPIAFVDEFQDTDPVQYEIFRTIYGEHAAVYVGDPKQAIYAFRGADVFSYLDAARHVGDRHHTLTTNRRSDPGLVHAVNVLFSHRERPFALDRIRMLKSEAHHQAPRSTLDPPMEIILLDEKQVAGPLEDTVSAMVANEIGHLLQSGAEIEGAQVAPKDVAVLCRTNRQALRVTEALRALQIPASLDGDSSVLSTDIADEVLCVLQAALMPGDSSAVRRALLTNLLGISPYELTTMDDPTWSDWVARFRSWHDKWQGEGVVRFLEDMLRTTGAETRIATHPSARRTLTDLLHIEELLLRGERERHRDPIALMLWFRRLHEGSPEDTAVAQEELQQRPDAESDTVRVTTIHKSKGLEYGVVYCPFPWNDARLFQFERRAVKFHDEADAYRAKIDLGSAQHAEHLEVSRRETLSEALRLLYVATTRAKHRCTLFWGPASNWTSSALAHLLHGEEPPQQMDDDDFQADVEALVAASSGAIGWRRAMAAPAPPFEREAGAGGLQAASPSRSFSLANRIASFTSLTGHHEKTPSPGPGAPLEEAPVALFSSLRGGARTGLLLHSILEEIDFQALNDDETIALVEDALRSYGYDPSLASEVRGDLRSVLDTPLISKPDAPRLADLPSGRQLRELEFTLRVRQPNLANLAKLLERHRAPSAAPGYPARLKTVTTQTLQSFLRGFIDLLFEWQGRWYIADYKSNSLPDYEPASIAEAVQKEHYLLQMQLYAGAAHRYLTQRIPRYDPDHHWGGSLLLFLRGMRGADHPGSSVFFDPQPPTLLAAIDEWLGGKR